MLAQVLLHPVETHPPVQHRLNLCTNLQRLIALMVNMPILLADMANYHVSNFALITELAAALREEHRLVKLHQISAFLFCTSRNRGRAFLKQRIIFKKLYCHLYSPSSKYL